MATSLETVSVGEAVVVDMHEYNTAVASTKVVVRLTATQIVTESGDKYSRRTGAQIGLTNSWRIPCLIFGEDAERFLRKFERKSLENSIRALSVTQSGIAKMRSLAVEAEKFLRSCGEWSDEPVAGAAP